MPHTERNADAAKRTVSAFPTTADQEKIAHPTVGLCIGVRRVTNDRAVRIEAVRALTDALPKHQVSIHRRDNFINHYERN